MDEFYACSRRDTAMLWGEYGVCNVSDVVYTARKYTAADLENMTPQEMDIFIRSQLAHGGDASEDVLLMLAEQQEGNIPDESMKNFLWTAVWIDKAFSERDLKVLRAQLESSEAAAQMLLDERLSIQSRLTHQREADENQRRQDLERQKDAAQEKLTAATDKREAFERKNAI